MCTVCINLQASLCTSKLHGDVLLIYVFDEHLEGFRHIYRLIINYNCTNCAVESTCIHHFHSLLIIYIGMTSVRRG